MRKPGNQTKETHDHNTAGFTVLQGTADRPMQFPTGDGYKNRRQQPCEAVRACPSDMADYLAEILASLEMIAQQHQLDVLSLMLTMARKQAEDDALSSRSR